ncbi:hypothetical protein SO802_012042 [Lithocarpus litseifolius]|uniref:Uncharacterized protein n=1 Tax=Lithocarpus litseifolius TaxID=425828 RepID=A0AAW2D2D4_9ROSI
MVNLLDWILCTVVVLWFLQRVLSMKWDPLMHALLLDEIIQVAFHSSATMERLCIWINFIFNLIVFLVLIILA